MEVDLQLRLKIRSPALTAFSTAATALIARLHQ